MYINRARRHEDLDSPKLTQQAENYGQSFLRKLGMVSCCIEAAAAKPPIVAWGAVPQSICSAWRGDGLVQRPVQPPAGQQRPAAALKALYFCMPAGSVLLQLQLLSISVHLMHAPLPA